jgi:hypothetical protein
MDESLIDASMEKISLRKKLKNLEIYDYVGFQVLSFSVH